MLHRIHQKLGTAGFIISIVALVAALGGAAYAAGGLTKSQEKQVTKIAKKYAGKPGAPGANGTNGTPGAKGDKGDPGTNGTNGANGKSVVIGAAGTHCKTKSGGALPGKSVEVEGSSSPSYVCNGEEGSPWTAGGTLPSGSSETGVWAYGREPEGTGITEEYNHLPISFPIPLAAALGEGHAFLIRKGQEGTAHKEECPGSYKNPQAAKGYFCAYTRYNTGAGEATVWNVESTTGAENLGEENAAGRSGAVLGLIATQGAEGEGAGDWAVTAP
jgi:hypothetical protein